LQERLPADLVSREYPEHMKIKADERKRNAAARLNDSGGGDGGGDGSSRSSRTAVELVPSEDTLLAKLWHQVLASPSGELSRVDLDRHLSTGFWRRSPSARSGTAEYDQHYIKLWKGRWIDFSKREAALRGGRGDATLDDDDPYWDAFQELVEEFRALLFDGHSKWDRDMNPQELYAEVAALYETCYQLYRDKAATVRRAQQSPPESAPHAAAMDGGARPMGVGCIKFPWRLAAKQLMEMKEKAPRLEAAQAGD